MICCELRWFPSHFAAFQQPPKCYNTDNTFIFSLVLQPYTGCIVEQASKLLLRRPWAEYLLSIVSRPFHETTDIEYQSLMMASIKQHCLIHQRKCNYKPAKRCDTCMNTIEAIHHYTAKCIDRLIPSFAPRFHAFQADTKSILKTPEYVPSSTDTHLSAS